MRLISSVIPWAPGNRFDDVIGFAGLEEAGYDGPGVVFIGVGGARRVLYWKAGVGRLCRTEPRSPSGTKSPVSDRRHWEVGHNF